LGCGEVQVKADFEAELTAMLDDAASALKLGDAAEGERRAKAISALVRAQREVAEYVAAERARAPEEDEQALRAELRRRLALYVDADRAGAPPDVLKQIGTGASAP
jgi:hypothetical protein